jgi:hypothetical protein
LWILHCAGHGARHALSRCRRTQGGKRLRCDAEIRMSGGPGA